MTEVEADQLREAVENMHGGRATLVQSVPVKETFMGGIVWEGVVHVFQLAGNLKANLAYAWSSTIEGNTKRHFFAVLRIPPIWLLRRSASITVAAPHRATMTCAPRYWPLPVTICANHCRSSSACRGSRFVVATNAAPYRAPRWFGSHPG